MANVLNTDKQIATAASAEGSSIRSIERITGVHRDTIMRLGVKVGQACTNLMDETMRDLSCTRLEMDEIWGFVGKNVIEDLKDVIRILHGVESTHLESVPVKEEFNGKTIWKGVVEVFKLHGHPQANTAYAWSHETDDPANPKRHVTVLHTPRQSHP